MTLVSCLSACGPSFDVGMQIDRLSSEPTTLLGSITEHPENKGLLRKAIIFEASDGEISCSGQTLNGEYKLSGFKDKYLYKFPIPCTDGSKGNLELRMTIPPPSGIGIGRMLVGSKIKVIIGDLAGTIGW